MPKEPARHDQRSSPSLVSQLQVMPIAADDLPASAATAAPLEHLAEPLPPTIQSLSAVDLARQHRLILSGVARPGRVKLA